MYPTGKWPFSKKRTTNHLDLWRNSPLFYRQIYMPNYYPIMSMKYFKINTNTVSRTTKRILYRNFYSIGPFADIFGKLMFSFRKSLVKRLKNGRIRFETLWCRYNIYLYLYSISITWQTPFKRLYSLWCSTFFYRMYYFRFYSISSWVKPYCLLEMDSL